MADITTALVKELRGRTGAGIMECKKALIEAKSDLELAIDNMRKFGQVKAIKKANRITAEGIVSIKIAQNKKYGIITELNCETDFVANNSDFKAFSDEIITTALNKHIINIETLRSKFEEQRAALVAKIGENINIRRLGFLTGDMIGSYLHGMRIGVIVSTTNTENELIKHIAMHIAARKPEYINKNDVPADVIAREHKIQLDIAMLSGKSREIAEKIVEGRMNKFINEISLIGQQFIMDPSNTIGHILEKQNAKIKNFIRFEVGEELKSSKSIS
ncbi:Elongation factor Ts [Candidatus Gullanella endobia]|uniref:Elongation factor Ts n=1 Tax=Candidatus Gullanella endobia TaxID=1070130 RepID=A0A143WPX9_9ENTR|nr:translation elongation factor Ts [Candidatus Gullanella endobia]CUX95788.1 Elongation factor Ts [Candidatus Gullanella endobia]